MPPSTSKSIFCTAPGDAMCAILTFGSVVPAFVLSTNTSIDVTKLQSSVSPDGSRSA